MQAKGFGWHRLLRRIRITKGVGESLSLFGALLVDMAGEGEEPVVSSSSFVGDLAGTQAGGSWRGNLGGNGGWATALVLLFLICWQLMRTVSGRRRLRRRLVAAVSTRDAGPTSAFHAISTSGISDLIAEEDLKTLINHLEGNFNDVDIWEQVIDKKNEKISYSAKCCKPKDGPLKYLSVTVFEKCSAEVVRDFYMDNEYRKQWDKTLVGHEQLEVDEASGTEIGHTIKKFPLLTPREYVLAWRVWEGKNNTFYCFIKDCEHPLAPRQKKYVRVGFFRSGWRIRKAPDRDACEIRVVHQEDAGLNVEMAKLVFAKGIWSYVCKMNRALHEYSLRSVMHSTSSVTSLRLVQVPPALEDFIRTSSSGSYESSGCSEIVKHGGGDVRGDVPGGMKLLKKPSKTWIAKGLLLVGGIVCLSRGHTVLGTQVAMACILKKFMQHGDMSSQSEPVRLSRGRRGHRLHS